MLPGALDGCTTDTVSLTVVSDETWMFRPDDVILLENNILNHEKHPLIRMLAAGEEMHRARLGDDLAEEGRLGRTV
jgi:hypothetical protein